MLHVIAVGIDRYQDSRIRRLHHSRDDAEAFGALFENGIHPDERRVAYLFDEEATKEAIMDKIGGELSRVELSADDVVVLYLACHGSPEIDQSPDETTRYIITHNTQYDKIYATGIDMERELPRWFDRLANPGLIVIFLDTCFSGRAGGRTFEGPTLRKARSVERATGSISLKPLNLGEGRIIMAACDDDQVAFESSELGHGLFTHALLKVLGTKPDSKNTISVSKLYDEVAMCVNEMSYGRQVPVINGRLKLAMLPLLTC